MALQDLIKLSNSNSKNLKRQVITEERIAAIKEPMRNYISFWREYPDLFIDFMRTGGNSEKEEESTFRLYFFQRIFLRVAMRYKYVYAVYPRACVKMRQ